MLILPAVVQYTRDEIVPQEAPHEIPDSKPAPEWPHDGAIEFRNVQMSYRAGLPNVLKGISISVEGGEKIGVVGRYVWSGCGGSAANTQLAERARGSHL